MADKQHGAWRSGNRFALPTSPHPRRRLLEIRNSCATLTHPTAQKIGHSNTRMRNRAYQLDLPHAIKSVNPDPDAITLSRRDENGGLYSVSSPLTTPITRGSLPHHANIGPP